MKFLKNQRLPLIMAVTILILSLAAKNLVCLPLGYDYSCTYGVPLAIWEIYSQDQVEHCQFIDGDYPVSAIAIKRQSLVFNILVDLSIILMIFFILQKSPKEERCEKMLRKFAFGLTICLALTLFTSVITPWSTGLYRFSYLWSVFWDSLIILTAIIKGIIRFLSPKQNSL